MRNKTNLNKTLGLSSWFIYHVVASGFLLSISPSHSLAFCPLLESALAARTLTTPSSRPPIFFGWHPPVLHVSFSVTVNGVRRQMKKWNLETKLMRIFFFMKLGQQVTEPCSELFRMHVTQYVWWKILCRPQNLCHMTRAIWRGAHGMPPSTITSRVKKKITNSC